MYQAYVDYEDMLGLTEGMIATVAQLVLVKLEISDRGTPISLTTSWRRVAKNDLLQ